MKSLTEYINEAQGSAIKFYPTKKIIENIREPLGKVPGSEKGHALFVFMCCKSVDFPYFCYNKFFVKEFDKLAYNLSDERKREKINDSIKKKVEEVLHKDGKLSHLYDKGEVEVVEAGILEKKFNKEIGYMEPYVGSAEHMQKFKDFYEDPDLKKLQKLLDE